MAGLESRLTFEPLRPTRCTERWHSRRSRLRTLLASRQSLRSRQKWCWHKSKPFSVTSLSTPPRRGCSLGPTRSRPLDCSRAKVVSPTSWSTPSWSRRVATRSWSPAASRPIASHSFPSPKCSLQIFEKLLSCSTTTSTTSITSKRWPMLATHCERSAQLGSSLRVVTSSREVRHRRELQTLSLDQLACTS
ncbi:unannotated protein [freshwater metagenome]|uniref:Unannotated protein n=1 Tax=freshwater metagenome TaxID=449393 RepID=A0A6J7AP07_9ZZZZ